MAYRQLLTASENPLGFLLLRRTLLNHKTQALQQGVLLPDDFIANIEGFAARNLMHIPLKGNKHRKEVCPSCLKAHILNAADKHELSEEAKTLLMELFKEEDLGHNGYYLDNSEVKKAPL